MVIAIIMISDPCRYDTIFKVIALVMISDPCTNDTIFNGFCINYDI